MKLKELHQDNKFVSAVPFFTKEMRSITALQILQGAKLAEHISKVPAVLLCVVGKVVYENKLGVNLGWVSTDLFI
jgi:hypothetical protein